MDGRWTFISFDWKVLRAVERPLRTAAETGDFSSLEMPAADDVLDSFDEDAEPSEVANAVISELCAGSGVVYFETGLPELVLWLRRQPGGDPASELLGELISASPNIEEWFQSEGGLAGILTAPQTRELANSFAVFRRRHRPQERSRGLAAFTRRFAATEPAAEHLDELIDLADEAAAGGLGIAVLRET